MEYLYLVPIFSAAIGCKINGGGGTGQIIFAKRKLMRLMVFLYY